MQFYISNNGKICIILQLATNEIIAEKQSQLYEAKLLSLKHNTYTLPYRESRNAPLKVVCDPSRNTKKEEQAQHSLVALMASNCYTWVSNTVMTREPNMLMPVRTFLTLSEMLNLRLLSSAMNKLQVMFSTNISAFKSPSKSGRRKVCSRQEKL